MGFAKDKKEMLAIGRIVNEEMITIFDLLRFLIDELLSSKVGSPFLSLLSTDL